MHIDEAWIRKFADALGLSHTDALLSDRVTALARKIANLVSRSIRQRLKLLALLLEMLAGNAAVQTSRSYLESIASQTIGTLKNMTAKATRAFAELQRKAYAYLQTSKLSVWIGIVMAVVFVKTSCSRSAIERDPLSRWAVATKTAFSYFRNLMTALPASLSAIINAALDEITGMVEEGFYALGGLVSNLQTLCGRSAGNHRCSRVLTALRRLPPEISGKRAVILGVTDTKVALTKNGRNARAFAVSNKGTPLPVYFGALGTADANQPEVLRKSADFESCVFIPKKTCIERGLLAAGAGAEADVRGVCVLFSSNLYHAAPFFAAAVIPPTAEHVQLRNDLIQGELKTENLFQPVLGSMHDPDFVNVEACAYHPLLQRIFFCRRMRRETQRNTSQFQKGENIPVDATMFYTCEPFGHATLAGTYKTVANPELSLAIDERISDMEFYGDTLYIVTAMESDDGGSYKLFKQNLVYTRGKMFGKDFRIPSFAFTKPVKIGGAKSYKPEAVTCLGKRLVLATDSETTKTVGCEDFMFSVAKNEPGKVLSYVNIDGESVKKGCSGLCVIPL
uniref:Uncharacterized protein n=1 Tax=viral metagenome TaxID=1070528 RepID=A0A6C0KCH1_9ZZZZ